MVKWFISLLAVAALVNAGYTGPQLQPAAEAPVLPQQSYVPQPPVAQQPPQQPQYVQHAQPAQQPLPQPAAPQPQKPYAKVQQTPARPSFDCLSKADGFYELGKCQNNYVQCLYGEASSNFCPANLVFDKDQCNYMNDCLNPTQPPPLQQQPQVYAPATQTETYVPLPEQQPAVSGYARQQQFRKYNKPGQTIQKTPPKPAETYCQDRNLIEGYHAPGCSTEYFACSVLSTIRINCPSGLFYDNEMNQCDYKRNIPICGGTRPAPTAQSPPANQYGTPQQQIQSYAPAPAPQQQPPAPQSYAPAPQQQQPAPQPQSYSPAPQQQQPAPQLQSYAPAPAPQQQPPAPQPQSYAPAQAPQQQQPAPQLQSYAPAPAPQQQQPAPQPRSYSPAPQQQQPAPQLQSYAPAPAPQQQPPAPQPQSYAPAPAPQQQPPAPQPQSYAPAPAPQQQPPAPQPQSYAPAPAPQQQPPAPQSYAPAPQQQPPAPQPQSYAPVPQQQPPAPQPQSYAPAPQQQPPVPQPQSYAPAPQQQPPVPQPQSYAPAPQQQPPAPQPQSYAPAPAPQQQPLAPQPQTYAYSPVQQTPPKPAETFCLDRNLDDGFHGKGCSPHFYVCAQTQTTKLECPVGLFYDQDTNECGHKGTIVSCGGIKPPSQPAAQQPQSSAYGQPLARQPPPPPEFDCTSRTDGIYVRGCNKAYFVCIQEKTMPLSCPSGLYYSAFTEMCDYKANVVECGGTAPTKQPIAQNPVMIPQSPYGRAPEQPAHQQPIAPQSSYAQTQTPSLQALAKSNNPCATLSNGIYGRKCSRFFFTCIQSKTYDFICPKDQAFNLKSVKCAPKVEISSCPEFAAPAPALQQQQPKLQQPLQQSYAPPTSAQQPTQPAAPHAHQTYVPPPQQPLQQQQQPAVPKAGSQQYL